MYTIKELINAGKIDPVIFELLGVFQEGIGADRISDLITFILIENIYSFTDRVLSQFNTIEKIEIENNQKTYQTCLNRYNNQPILLLPKSILSPLVVAERFDDIDLICMENERVRQIINSYIDLGRRKKLKKNEVLALMKSSDNFVRELIQAYKTYSAHPYDFEKDPVGEYIWYEESKRYADTYPIKISMDDNPTINDVFSIVEKICYKFKSLIEDNGLWELLYDNDKVSTKHERSSQLLFFGIADSYCTANNIDLTRESNAGRGAVDFKLSSGAEDKVVVEVKLTSNSQLKHGIEKQLPIYMKQEKTDKAIYLIIDNGHPKRLDDFYDFHYKLDFDTKQKTPFIVIDGTNNKKSASKA